MAYYLRRWLGRYPRGFYEPIGNGKAANNGTNPFTALSLLWLENTETMLLENGDSIRT